MELVSSPLSFFFDQCSKSFSLKTISMLAIQMLERIESLHNSGFIHRDIKPENFAFGVNDCYNKSEILYLLDFNLSKKYTLDNKQHIPQKDKKAFTGNARFASLNALLAKEQSRRDDLESLVYMLIFLFNGTLPWIPQNDLSNNNEFKLAKKLKASLNTEELCFGLPKEFEIMLKYIKQLTFEQTPDYDYLKQLFVLLLEKNKEDHDNIYDWHEKKSFKKVVDFDLNALNKANSEIDNDSQGVTCCDSKEIKNFCK